VVVIAVVVIVVIPILLIMPTVRVFIPPTMTVLPAVMPRFRKFLAPVLCVGTIRTVFLNRFVELMISVNRAFLAVIIRSHR